MFVGVFACDSLKEDFIAPENQITFSQTEFYILPSSSTVEAQKKDPTFMSTYARDIQPARTLRKLF
jgi:hypothetical protein